MRLRPSLTPVLVAILACGDAGGGATMDTGDSTVSASTATGTTEHPTTGGSTTSSTSDPGTTAATGTTSTTAPGTTEPDTTGGTDPGTTTGPSTTSTSDTTAGGSTGGQGDIEYAAFYVPGGLDRIVVRKADHGADLCTSVVFVSPMPNIQPDLFIPEMWSFQGAEIAQGTTDCLVLMAPLLDAVAAADIFGMASWPSPGPCPGTLDIDATLVFPPGMPWVPAQDSLSATGLPLQGC